MAPASGTTTTAGSLRGDASDRPPHISCVGRSVRVREPELFSTPTSARCLRFLDAIFQLSDVHAVELNCRKGVASITYRGKIQASTLLERMAEALRRESPAHRDELQHLLQRHDGPTVTIYHHACGFSTWDMARCGEGLLQVRRSDIRTRFDAQPIRDHLMQRPGIRDLQWQWFTRQLILKYDARLATRDLLAWLDEAVQPVPGGLARLVEEEAAIAVQGVRRGLYLVLAGVSFCFAVVAVVVPGLPTVPLLLVTSYFLVHASPALNERLLQSRAFGPLLRDWHEHRGMRPRLKAVALTTMLVAVAVSVFFAGLSPPALVIVLVLVAVGVFVILRTPTISYSYDPFDAQALLVSPALGP